MEGYGKSLQEVLAGSAATTRDSLALFAECRAAMQAIGNSLRRGEDPAAIEIRSLTVQEGRLDQWYRDLVNAQTTVPATKAGGTIGNVAPASDGASGRAMWCVRALRDRL